MANKNKNNKNTDIDAEAIEDVTMYGEFIPSFDQWMTPDKQKMSARHLEEVTKELSPSTDEASRKNSMKSSAKNSKKSR